MKAQSIFTGALCTFLLLSACGENQQMESEVTDLTKDAVSTGFSAVDMPSILANGDPFPTDSSQINSWIAQNEVSDEGLVTNKNIIGHAWGLWQALTELTDQKYNGRELRRFETWYTPQDVISAMDQGVSLEELVRDEADLQFRKKFTFGHEGMSTEAGDISGKVKYNTPMAQMSLDGRYFDSTALKKLAVAGEINTVAFQPNSIMLKPIYRVLTDMNKVKGEENMYYFQIWGGKQDAGKPIQKFSKSIQVATDPDNPKIDNVSVFSIEDFIHHDMSAAEAYTYNHSSKEGQEFNDTAHVGDPVILLGMHVSTRETDRWTWQSFFWSESPDNPVFPSSATIAEGRNNLKTKLSGPTNNYVATIGYSMMTPQLPYKSGGPVDIKASGVRPVYALNPYIEGTFGTDVFPDQTKVYSGDYQKQFYPSNIDGITSNCMSCHSQAAYFGNNNDVPPFLADQYINRDAPWFIGSVQLDFAWSLFPGFEPARPQK